MKPVKLLKRKIKIKILRSILGNRAKGIIYDSQNGIISAPVDDDTIGRYLGKKGYWNIDEIERLLKHISCDDTVYIIGTHIGTLLIPISDKCKIIVGYEANPDTFWHVSNNISLNGIENSRLFNLAVGSSEKEVSFYKNTLNSGGSKIKPIIDDYMYRYDKPSCINVQMVRLSHHIEKNNLPHPDHIIMDIEGSEYFALQGMQETLEKTKTLYIEYVPHHLKNVSGVSCEEFASLISPYFETITFMKTGQSFDLKTSNDNFLFQLKTMFDKETSDDLLFTKTRI